MKRETQLLSLLLIALATVTAAEPNAFASGKDDVRQAPRQEDGTALGFTPPAKCAPSFCAPLLKILRQRANGFAQLRGAAMNDYGAWYVSVAPTWNERAQLCWVDWNEGATTGTYTCKVAGLDLPAAKRQMHWFVQHVGDVVGSLGPETTDKTSVRDEGSRTFDALDYELTISRRDASEDASNARETAEDKNGDARDAKLGPSKEWVVRLEIKLK